MTRHAILIALTVLCCGGNIQAQLQPAPPAPAPAPPPAPYGMPIMGQMAQTVMTAAQSEAERNNWKLSIAIVDTSGNLVMFKMMDGAPFISRDVSLRKARTAAAFRIPTKVLAEAAAKASSAPTITQVLPEYVALEGGIPITIGDQIVGAIGVSGARSFEDAQVAKKGADAVR